MYQAYRRKITLREIAEIYVYIEIDRLSTFDGFGHLIRKKVCQDDFMILFKNKLNHSFIKTPLDLKNKF